MSDPTTVIPPRYLCTPEAACFLGLSYRTLEKHRSYGTGLKRFPWGYLDVCLRRFLVFFTDVPIRLSMSALPHPGKRMRRL